MTTPTPIQETWQEELRDEIYELAINCRQDDRNRYDSGRQVKNILSKISNLLQRKERETISKIQEMIVTRMREYDKRNT